MQFEYSAKVESLRARLDAFMQEFIYPNGPAPGAMQGSMSWQRG